METHLHEQTQPACMFPRFQPGRCTAGRIFAMPQAYADFATLEFAISQTQGESGWEASLQCQMPGGSGPSLDLRPHLRYKLNHFC
eukprot:3941239-Rhodomonas_salina.2